MIDTVCLLIPKYKMAYLSDVSSWDLYSKTAEYERYVRNPSKAEKETGKYFPRLTGYKRGYTQEESVRIEFSAPKLLYSNNLDELSDADFPEVIETLKQRLETMGVMVAKSVLEKASVSSVHFSKNIALQDGYTSNYLISEMNKVNLRKSFDFARSRYINDGQSLYAHTTSHQLIIYDKVADLGKDKKRAIDKEQTLYQMSLFSELKTQNELPEIIRFEVRLSKKQKLNSLLESLGYQGHPTFKQVFSSQMSRAVLLSYWKKLIKERNLGLFTVSLSNKDVLQTMFLANQNLKPKQAIYLFGLFVLARDEQGMRQLRAIVSKKAGDRTWYRIAQDMQEATELITQNKVRDWVAQIDKCFDEYKPYRYKNHSSVKIEL